MKRKYLIVSVIITSVTISFYTNTFAKSNKERIAELERRIEALEKIVYGDSQDTLVIYESEEISEPFVLSPGVYIIGQDVEPGHYSVKAVGGSSGIVATWENYETYKENAWSTYYADFSQEIRCEEYTSSIEDIQELLDGIPTKISNIILEDGCCLTIKDVIIQMTKK